MKKDALACRKKDALLPVYLPIEIEILLSMERAMYFIACGTEILRKTNILHVEKVVLNNQISFVQITARA